MLPLEGGKEAIYLSFGEQIAADCPWKGVSGASANQLHELSAGTLAGFA